MGQLSVLLLVGALFAGGLVLLSAQDHTVSAAETTAEYASDFLAREAASLGVQRVVRNLVAQPAAWSSDAAAMDGLFGEGGVHRRGGYATPYRVRVTAAYLGTPPAPGAPITDPDRVEITSTGQAVTGADTTDYVIRAVYERGYTNIGVPPALRYAILADDDLTLQGNAHVVGSIHTNTDLGSIGNGFSVNGAATYTGGWDGSQGDNYTGGTAYQDRIDVPAVAIPPATFTLQKNGTGGKKVFEIRAVDNPRDVNGDGAAAVSEGWYGVTGKGTEAAPYVLYVNGNLTISEDIRLPGHVKIYVSGNLLINSNARLTQVQPGTPLPVPNTATDAEVLAWRDTYARTNTIGVFVGGSTEFNGTPFINAQLHSEGDVVYKGGGNKLVLGGVVSRGQIVVQGNPRIYYNQAATSVFDPGYNLMQPDGLVLVSYREWGERSSD